MSSHKSTTIVTIDTLHKAKMYSFDEASRILTQRYRIYQPSVRYLICPSKQAPNYSPNALSLERPNITAFESDIPMHSNKHGLLFTAVDRVDENYRNLFFLKSEIDAFTFHPAHTPVPFAALAANRFWGGTAADISKILLNAVRDNILSIFDPAINNFTKYLPNLFAPALTNVQINNPFAHISSTQNAQEYTENPESFYLLYEILMIERLYMNKTLDKCIEELYGNTLSQT